MPKTYTAKEMLAKLVSFPTVSQNSNLDLIRFVESYLADHGVASRLTYDDTGEKANLHAVIGPQVDGGVVLSGHTDVVPTEGQNWSSDPFVLTERDGALFGRGAADMKAFSAIALALVPEMIAAPLRRPIHIALSYDEEVGCLGAPRLIDDMMAEGPRPVSVIVGEPTLMKVVVGQKGTALLRTSVTGYPVHSSQLNRGASAITAAARLITWLDEQTSANAAAADPACRFDPPYTTLHCGTVSGGTAHNIVAQNCSFLTDIRWLPDERLEDWVARYETYVRDVVEPDLQARHPDTSIEIEQLAYVPGLRPEPFAQEGASSDGDAQFEAEALARRITGDNERTVVVYGTEAGQFQAAGLSVVVCGPGSIDQAHQPDEFITVAQLLAGETFIRKMIGALAT